jgi:hypothetical protein
MSGQLHLRGPRTSNYERSPLPAALVNRDIGAAFVVIDRARQKLSYVYYEDEPGPRSAAKLLTKDEARRIVANIAKLQELLWQHNS